MDRFLDERRHDEIRRELKQDRRRLRELAQARCPKDNRAIGAVCLMTDGYWLWHLDERFTPDQARHEALWMAGMEYDTAVESGMDSGEAWELVLPVPDDIEHVRRTPRSERIVPFSDPLPFYRSSSPEQVGARWPRAGDAFATCPKCKLTYVMDYAVMGYAAGRAVHTHSRKPVIVHPGRRLDVGPRDPEPAFGLDHPWRPTPWTIVGLDTPTATA